MDRRPKECRVDERDLVGGRRDGRPGWWGRWRAIVAGAAIALAGATLIAAPALAAVPTGNLLFNPGAEAAPSAEGDGTYGAPQGWTATALEGGVALEAGTQGPFDSCYGGADGESNALETSVGVAIGGGARYFYAGEDESATLTQEVSVTAEAEGRTLLIGGDFGGWESQEDHAMLEARFFNLDHTVEPGPALVTGAVSAADRGGETGLLPRQASGTVPAGTRFIRFVLSQIREVGTDNDGYADNLYATFDAAPPARPAPTGDAACPLVTAPVTTPVTTPPPAAPAAPAPAPIPPAVKITSGPAHETADAKAVFAFTGAPGGSYECSLDGSTWKPCKSGRDFGPARPGDHLFQVREKLSGATSAIASYRWTVDLPKACVLRVARARVFAYTTKSKARLVIHYTTYRPAKVTVAYSLKGSKGGLALGSATAQFHKAGVFRLPVRLGAAEKAKLDGAKSFAVRFRIPKTPSSCGRYYTKRLTIPRKISGQTVWFQSDSLFTAAG
jgi:hypothetical protein